MRKYIISYERNGRQIKTSRRASSAAAAVEALCNQYGYEYRIKQIDADTYGKTWAWVAVLRPEICATPSWIFDAMAEISEEV